MDSFNRALGERLRAARKKRGWSLHDVEAASENEFKASVLGAYERGERSLSVARLHRLAQLYGIAAARLLPGSAGDDGASFDLDALTGMSEIQSNVVERFLASIQMMRHDGSSGLAVRQSDLEMLAALLDAERVVDSDRAGREER